VCARLTLEQAYCATKWAVEGLTESLMYELDPFGITVTLVEPGASRRDEPDENINGPSPMWGHFLMKPPTDAYRATTSPAQHATRMVDWLRFSQPTSAVKISKMVWELGHCKYPPLRLLLGSHAVESIRDRLRNTIEEVSSQSRPPTHTHTRRRLSGWQIEDWKHLNSPNEPPAATATAAGEDDTAAG
jgi:short-subunit dehydrogenase